MYKYLYLCINICHLKNGWKYAINTVALALCPDDCSTLVHIKPGCDVFSVANIRAFFLFLLRRWLGVFEQLMVRIQSHPHT